jgi:hypothetical protein
MNRLPVAIIGQRAIAEPLRQRLESAGIHAEIHDELRLEKLWESHDRAPFVRLEVPAENFERACNLLHEWDRQDGALRVAFQPIYEVRTEGEFDVAIGKAWNDRRAFSLIQAHIPHGDASDALKRLTERLSKRV